MLENGEYYVSGVRVEHKNKDVYQLNGAEFEVKSEFDDDFYVNGNLVRRKKSYRRNRR